MEEVDAKGNKNVEKISQVEKSSEKLKKSDNTDPEKKRKGETSDTCPLEARPSTSAKKATDDEIADEMKTLKVSSSEEKREEVEGLLRQLNTIAIGTTDITMLLSKLKQANNLAFEYLSQPKIFEALVHCSEVLYTFLLPFINQYGIPWTHVQETALMDIDYLKKKAKNVKSISKRDYIELCLQYDICSCVVYLTSKKFSEFKTRIDRIVAQLNDNFTDMQKAWVYAKACNIKFHYFHMISENDNFMIWSERCFETLFKIHTMLTTDKTMFYLYGFVLDFGSGVKDFQHPLLTEIMENLLSRHSSELTPMEDLANCLAVAWLAEKVGKKKDVELMIKLLDEMKFPKPSPRFNCVLYGLLHHFIHSIASLPRPFKKTILSYALIICLLQPNTYQRLFVFNLLVDCTIFKEDNYADWKNFVVSLTLEAISQVEKVRQNNNSAWIRQRLYSMRISLSFWYARVQELDKSFQEARKVIDLCLSFKDDKKPEMTLLLASAYYISAFVLFHQSKYMEANKDLVKEIELLNNLNLSMRDKIMENAKSNLNYIKNLVVSPRNAMFLQVPSGLGELSSKYIRASIPYYMDFSSLYI